MKYIVHVNQHNIKHNRKFAGLPRAVVKPVLTVKTYKQNKKDNKAAVRYKGKIIGYFLYSPEKPLPCGAHVWFETVGEHTDVVTPT